MFTFMCSLNLIARIMPFLLEHDEDNFLRGVFLLDQVPPFHPGEPVESPLAQRLVDVLMQLLNKPSKKS